MTKLHKAVFPVAGFGTRFLPATKAMPKELLPIVDKVPGFRGKESYAHISGDGRVNTISYWVDEESLAAWTRDPRHREAMAAGKDHVFSRYEIRICSQIRHYGHSVT